MQEEERQSDNEPEQAQTAEAENVRQRTDIQTGVEMARSLNVASGSNTRISNLMAVLLVFIAICADLATFIPLVGDLVAPAYWFAMVIYLWTIGCGFLNARRLATELLSFVLEMIPGLQELPTIFLATILIIVFVRLEDRTGLKLAKPFSEGKRPLNANGFRSPTGTQAPANADGRREPRRQTVSPAIQAPGPDGGASPGSEEATGFGEKPLIVNESQPSMSPEEKHYWDIKNDYDHHRQIMVKEDPDAALHLIEPDRSYRDIIERAASIGKIPPEKVPKYLAILTPIQSARTEENPLAA